MMADGSPHTLRQAPLLPLLFESDQNGGWNQGMAAVTHALLASVTLAPGPILEVGCGGGQLLAALQQQYPARLVMGVDLHPLALIHARGLLRFPAGLAQAALPHLPWQDNHFALVLALDVFDQQGVEMGAAVAEAYRLLRPGGTLVMRVSAHPRLYGAHDLAFHTGQRYTRSQVRAALLRAGFGVQRLTYANATLAIPVAALRLAQRWGMIAWRSALYQRTQFYEAAAWILRREARWLHHADLPWGLSLCAVARKPAGD